MYKNVSKFHLQVKHVVNNNHVFVLFWLERRNSTFWIIILYLISTILIRRFRTRQMIYGLFLNHNNVCITHFFISSYELTCPEVY